MFRLKNLELSEPDRKQQEYESGYDQQYAGFFVDGFTFQS
jgi:hypothetical protein